MNKKEKEELMMSYIPDRHCPEKGGYDYNILSEYEKGLLDGMDLVIMDDVLLADSGVSLIRQAIDHAYDQMSSLEQMCFDKMKEDLIDHIERYIDAMANELYTTMCEDDEREHAPAREYEDSDDVEEY